MNREVLERPFEADQIKTRPGAHGDRLSYVEGADYIRRLNEAFDGAWSFKIEDHHIMQNHVVVIGKLTAGHIEKMAFGGSAITFRKNSKEPANIADDLKAAATDSLKKAASMLGVGLHLYSDDRPQKSAVPAAPSVPSNQQQSPRPSPPTNRTRSRSGLTERQLSAIMSLASNLGIPKTELRQRTVNTFGVPPEELTKADASTLIGKLVQLSTTASDNAH